MTPGACSEFPAQLAQAKPETSDTTANCGEKALFFMSELIVGATSVEAQDRLLHRAGDSLHGMSLARNPGVE